MSTAEIDSDLTSENPVIINNNDSNENMEENYSSIGNNTKYADEKRDEFEEDLEEDNNVTSEGDNEEGDNNVTSEGDNEEGDNEEGDNEEEDNNVTSEGDNEEEEQEDLEEDDEEEDLEEDDEEEVLTLSDDTEVYILCKDNIALCYFGTKNLAVETMWKIARQDKGKFMDSFTVFIKENDEDSIDIVGYHKFLVFSYERVFSTFTILPVKSVATTMYETKEVSHEDTQEATQEATQEVASPMDDVQKVSQADTQEVESTMNTTTRSRWWG